MLCLCTYSSSPSSWCSLFN